MKRLPIGIQTFRDIVLNDYLYLDKTEKILKDVKLNRDSAIKSAGNLAKYCKKLKEEVGGLAAKNDRLDTMTEDFGKEIKELKEQTKAVPEMKGMLEYLYNDRRNWKKNQGGKGGCSP